MTTPKAPRAHPVLLSSRAGRSCRWAFGGMIEHAQAAQAVQDKRPPMGAHGPTPGWDDHCECVHAGGRN